MVLWYKKNKNKNDKQHNRVFWKNMQSHLFLETWAFHFWVLFLSEIKQ